MRKTVKLRKRRRRSVSKKYSDWLPPEPIALKRRMNEQIARVNLFMDAINRKWLERNG